MKGKKRAKRPTFRWFEDTPIFNWKSAVAVYK